jgi:uncharacterized protein YjiS (DUF1127 family)
MSQATHCTRLGVGESVETGARGIGFQHLQWLGAAPLVAAIHWLEDGWRRRQVIRELNRLDDRELRDIGFVRGEIEEVADAAVKRFRADRQ